MTHHHLQHSEGLLIQFILSELFSSHKSVQILYNKLESDALEHTELKKLLRILLGSFSVPSSMLHEDGSLTKLQHYSYAFSNHFQNQSLSIHQFQKEIQDGLKEALIIKELLFKHKFIENETVSIHIATLLETLHRASSHLIEILPMHNQNENLVFFLLRHKEDLNQLLRTSQETDSLQAIFQKDLDELKEFLLQKYAARGFHHILSTINALK